MAAYTEMAGSRLMGGHSEEALAWADKALALGRELELPNMLAKALDYRGLARCDLGDLDGVDDMREALAIAHELGATRDIAVLLSNIAGLRWAMEGPVAALETFHEALDLAQRRGMVGTVMWLQGNMLQPLFELGRWDEVVRVAQEVTDWGRSDESEYAVVYALLSEAYLFLARGERARAEPLVAAFLDRSRDIGDPQLLLGALATAAIEAHEAGRFDEAVALVTEAESLATEIDRTGILPRSFRTSSASRARTGRSTLPGGSWRGTRRACPSCITRASSWPGRSSTRRTTDSSRREPGSPRRPTRSASSATCSSGPTHSSARRAVRWRWVAARTQETSRAPH